MKTSVNRNDKIKTTLCTQLDPVTGRLTPPYFIIE